MRLHQRGVDLLCNLMDAESHVEALTEREVRELLTQTISVLGDLLRRDIPEEPDERPTTQIGLP
jgi:hypothetical protein